MRVFFPLRSTRKHIKWNPSIVKDHNIEFQLQSPQEFFGRQPNTLPPNLDPNVVTAAIAPDRFPPDRNLSDTTHRLLTYLQLARNHPCQSSLIDATKEVLHAAGYESKQGLILRSQYPLELDDGHKRNLLGPIPPDLCLTHYNHSILLLVQVIDNWMVRNPPYPESQVIAAVIAAFQHNNEIRSQIRLKELEKLESMTIPAIVVGALCPHFYKIPITAALSDAVAYGNPVPPSLKTVVSCTGLGLNRLEHHLHLSQFRAKVFSFYEAFRPVSEECWNEVISY